MLDEYKSPHSFWAKAVNTACHASNRLFLCKILEKTPYELLTRNKPNFKYFRVFGCTCFILNKKDRLGKFQSKTIDGIVVGYGSNSHAYRVYNKSTRCVVETCDVVFDEFNGSHGEQVDLSDVGDEDPSQDILSMGVGALLPMEQVPHQDEEEDTSPIHVQATTSLSPPQDPIAQDVPIIQEQEQDSKQEQEQEQEHAYIKENEEIDDEPQQVQREEEYHPPHINDPYV